MLRLNTTPYVCLSKMIRVRVLVASFAVFVYSFFGMSIYAQTTEFVFQGQLQNSSMPANGSFDFEFLLFDTLAGPNQIGSTLTRSGVTAANGIFSVKLDFGSNYPGANRFLEIHVRQTGGGAYTPLAPRQPLTSAPYAVKALSTDTATNALQLGGVAASQYVVTTDPRMTDDRPPTAGSTNYIQNTTSPQATSNFNISGTGTANILNAATQFNLNGNRILSSPAGSFNLFSGFQTGQAITTGMQNSFFGSTAGQSNTTGNNNSFFGTSAGINNTTGINNAFFGSGAGVANTTASANSFFGTSAGQSNSLGTDNAFFGGFAGQSNTGGNSNSFFGRNAGVGNTNGFNNSFFGRDAGQATTNSSNNSFFGVRAGFSNTTASNNSFFGSISGEDNTTGYDNAFFGTSAGSNTTTGFNNAFFGRASGDNNTTGDHNTFFGSSAGNANTTGDHNTIFGGNADVGSGNLSFATAIGASAVVTASNTVVLGRSADIVRVPGTFASVGQITTNGNLVVLGTSNLIGAVDVATLGAAGSTDVCRNASNQLSTCSSSLRYKTGVNPFFGGLDVVRRLRPITFDWKDGGMHDVGFGAEDVEQIEPLLTTRNDKGEIEGVKYGQITTVLVNAVKEQQEQIEAQQKQIEQQRKQIESLTKIVCAMNPMAVICQH